MRQTRSGPELGRRIGTYHAVGTMGALAQFALRTITLLALVMIGALVWIRPDSTLLKSSVTAAVVIVLFGLRLAWRFVTARCGGNQCRLHQGGVVVTGPFGGVRGTVAWREVTGLRRMSNASLLMAFHRMELERRGGPPLTFIALGFEPALVEVLVKLAARNGLE
ncbi:hypothetical protein [Streptomyces sp. V2I9]|uniref:hypothetical protein n=1 Tax=Streptomyces sp. V2I9 TaxID=3042304 RepID=UPI0027854D3C|nr:hypothetical protein [Streptomyces sp. V2I9]MDQ0982739.1 hypothetical protein [Streptomyces sp. V2I9]